MRSVLTLVVQLHQEVRKQHYHHCQKLSTSLTQEKDDISENLPRFLSSYRTTTTLKFYPFAPLENNNLEQSLEQSLIDVKSLKNFNNNLKQMITYLKNKNHESKRNMKSINHHHQ